MQMQVVVEEKKERDLIPHLLSHGPGFPAMACLVYAQPAITTIASVNTLR